MAQLGYKFIMAPGISHDKHLGIETLEIRKLTERILNFRRMLYLKETIGHHHLAAQRIRLKPHNVYRTTPIHEFLIGEWRNFRKGGTGEREYRKELPQEDKGYRDCGWGTGRG